MKYLILLSLPLITLLASCSSTPTSRIEKHPKIYQDLSPKHQELVSQGRITKGMTKPAVFLAMGHPDRRISVNKDDTYYERWDYTVLSPVYSGGHGFGHGGFSQTGFRRSGFRRGGFGRGGFGRGRFGHGGFHGGFGYSSSITYLPSIGASVKFTNEKVSGWTAIQRGNSGF